MGGNVTAGVAGMGWAWWEALAAVARLTVWSWPELNPMTAPASNVSSNRPATALRCDINALLPTNLANLVLCSGHLMRQPPHAA